MNEQKQADPETPNLKLNNRPNTAQSTARMQKTQRARPQTTSRMKTSRTQPVITGPPRVIHYRVIQRRSPTHRIGTAPRFPTYKQDTYGTPGPTSYTPDTKIRIGRRNGLCGKFGRQHRLPGDKDFVTPLLAYSTKDPRYMIGARGGMFTNHTTKFGKDPRMHAENERFGTPGPGHVGGMADGRHTATATARSKAPKLGNERRFFGFKSLKSGGYEFEYKPNTFGKNYDGRLDQNRGARFGKYPRSKEELTNTLNTPGPNAYHNDPSAHHPRKYNGFKNTESGVGDSTMNGGVIGREVRFKEPDAPTGDW